ncbi:MAG: sigma-54-dependent Fis family transcriptional regulator [Acidobacteria bacterium]|nr:sigma-54-dependent Fis family transcriptional regulator [Acidobacteriota bacterium]
MDLLGLFVNVLHASQSLDEKGGFAQAILDCLIAATGAERGFVVVKENDQFIEKVHLRFDREKLPEDKRQFSRSLIRETLRTGMSVVTDNISADPRFKSAESALHNMPAPVMTLPLGTLESLYGAVYLERKPFSPSFEPGLVESARKLCQLAGQEIFRSLRLQELESLWQKGGAQLFAEHDFQGIVGKHPKMVQLLKTVVQLAQSDSTVLIRGETGVGKELIARAIFANSSRRDKPFVTLHCGALPETLFESELFGHKRGSFTGATQDRTGRILQASGGTLFIDEVAEIPLSAQAKLLRFFQFGEYQRIGSDRVEKVDVRVIAATHRSLKEMVAAGQFREDLYYRLNVLELQIPALRERKDDIPLLIQHFLTRQGRSGDLAEIAPDALSGLMAYDYPGNVRELAHAIERLCVLGKNQRLDACWLPREILACVPQVESSHAGQFFKYSNQELKAARDKASQDAIELVEREFLEGLMKKHDQQVGRAARESGLHRTYLYRLLGKYNLGPSSS